jgi:hypothetical protein
MLANILRTGILAASAALPENAAIANVVFASSMQILIAVGYFLIFTIVTATYRVLSAREAMHDPSSITDVDFDSEDELELNFDERHSKVKKSRLQILRNLRDNLHREADRLASNLFSKKVGWSQTPVTTEEPEDDNFSVISNDETSLDNKADTKPLCNSVRLPIEAADTSNHSKKIVPESYPMPYTGGEPSHTHDHAKTYIEDETEVNIFSEVYALGICVFIMHYCLDAASMNPTLFMLLGLTILAMKDEVRVSREDVGNGKADQALILIRGLSICAFFLIVGAQICIIVGIARVPSYHAATRDGGILKVPAPSTVLEICLAMIFPLICPGALHFIRRRTRANDVSRLLHTALPCTVIVALWFITCFGAMNDQIRDRLGVSSVNTTITALTTIDDKQIPTLLIAPFFKVPALLCIISCCLSGKTIDIVCSLALIFYVKQYTIVRDTEMRQMLLMSLIFTSFAWTMCTLRYWRWLMLWITNLFAR